MPKFYCEYCDIYLTHSSPVGRRQHNHGRKHVSAKIEYFQNLIREEGITPQNFLVFLNSRNYNNPLYPSGGYMNNYEMNNMYAKYNDMRGGPGPYHHHHHTYRNMTTYGVNNPYGIPSNKYIRAGHISPVSSKYVNPKYIKGQPLNFNAPQSGNGPYSYHTVPPPMNTVNTSNPTFPTAPGAPPISNVSYNSHPPYMNSSARSYSHLHRPNHPNQPNQLNQSNQPNQPSQPNQQNQPNQPIQPNQPNQPSQQHLYSYQYNANNTNHNTAMNMPYANIKDENKNESTNQQTDSSVSSTHVHKSSENRNEFKGCSNESFSTSVAKIDTDKNSGMREVHTDKEEISGNKKNIVGEKEERKNCLSLDEQETKKENATNFDLVEKHEEYEKHDDADKRKIENKNT